MSIYEKLAKAREQFHTLELKKSGHNKFAGYRYFELADFVQPGMRCLAENGLVPVISFDAAEATMTLHEIDGGGSIVIRSPMSSAALKGCHEVQNLGAVQTYLRRYLWTAALEIIEHDALDSSQPVENAPELVTQSQVVDLETLIADVGADQGKFSTWLIRSLKVPDGDLARIPKSMYPQVVAALESKRKAA